MIGGDHLNYGLNELQRLPLLETGAVTVPAGDKSILDNSAMAPTDSQAPTGSTRLRA